MKTILKVKQFLEEFVEEEYKVNVSKIDRSVSDENHNKSVVDFFEKYYSPFYRSLKLGGMIVRLLDDLDEEIIQGNLKALQKRDVFLIKKYNNTQFGKGILNDEKESFSCFLGLNKKYEDDEDVYMQNFIITTYQGELKIVSKRTILDYEGDKLNWGYDKRSVEKADGMTVFNNGELVDVLRLREPDHEFWKRDYNEEN